eukprot:2418955-Prymnesium_polylepis.1
MRSGHRDAMTTTRRLWLAAARVWAAARAWGGGVANAGRGPRGRRRDNCGQQSGRRRGGVAGGGGAPAARRHHCHAAVSRARASPLAPSRAAFAAC